MVHETGNVQAHRGSLIFRSTCVKPYVRSEMDDQNDSHPAEEDTQVNNSIESGRGLADDISGRRKKREIRQSGNSNDCMISQRDEINGLLE